MNDMSLLPQLVCTSGWRHQQVTNHNKTSAASPAILATQSKSETLGDSWAGVGPNYYQSSSLIVVLLIMPVSASHHYPGSRGGHLALAPNIQVGCQNYPGNMSAKQYSFFLPFHYFLCYKMERIYFSHTKGRMGVYYKFDNKNFMTKIKCGQKGMKRRASIQYTEATVPGRRWNLILHLYCPK